MTHPVGIDLGTTNSAVATVDEHGLPVIVPNRLGEPVTPSVLCFRGDEVLVGREAKELQAAGEPLAAAFFKRQMGDRGYVFFAAGRDHSATDLSALLLAALKRDAEHGLGGPVSDAVITVPAYFRNPQRAATIEAGGWAGLDVLQVINEPTAAAIAYGLDHADAEQTLLVYDLGGGTFDVTLLRLSGGELRILSSDGDHELGGKDWDDRIVEFLAGRFEDEFGADPLRDLESLNDLLVRAEEVKKRLSSVESAPIAIVHDGERGRYTLDRATFEEITADLMERTIALTAKVLDDQGVVAAAIDGVLLVGGSTRMPMVHRYIERTFGRPPLHGVDPDQAVALGAARMAAQRVAERGGRTAFSLAGAVRTTDVTNHSLGMIALSEDRSAFVNSIILAKNLPVPCCQSRPYQHRARRRGGGPLEIYMTQGESESPAEVSYLGKYALHDVPVGAGGLAVLDVEYRYDASGTVEVAGRDRASGRPLRLTVEPLPADVPERFLRPPEAAVEAVHVTAYLTFDLSGSMAGEPLDEAKKAARGFLENVDLAHCSLGIVAFADSVRLKLAASRNGRQIERAIHGLTLGEVGGCNRAEPFTEARRLLRGVEGPRLVITLTDGRWADQPAAIRCARALIDDGVESIAIGFGGADRQFLAAIASADEASFFTSLEGLVETFVNIAQVLTESHGGAALAPGTSGSPRPVSGGGSLLRRLFGT